nr:helix-turn-helix transcriptional regulator [uncultured Blautia sp.]
MINKYVWNIGNTIKILRESQGIKQQQLCKGLCSVATLCKFENGDRELDYFLVSTLMQRLGYGLDKYEFYGSNEEWLQWEQMYEINQFRQKKQLNQLYDSISRYQNTWKDNIQKNNIQKQFVTWILGILESWNENYEKSIFLFQKAISYTVHEWKNIDYHKNILSIRELEILADLGDTYNLFTLNESGFEILQSVWHYLEQNVKKNAETLPLFTSTMLKLVPYLLHNNCYWEGLSLCKKTLTALSSCNRIDNWSDILYWKGKFEHELLNINEYPESQVIKTYKRAYYAALLFKKNDYTHEIKSFLESRGYYLCTKLEQ